MESRRPFFKPRSASMVSCIGSIFLNFHHINREAIGGQIESRPDFSRESGGHADGLGEGFRKMSHRCHSPWRESARGPTLLFFDAVYLPFLAQSFYEPKVMMKKEIFINQSILRRRFFHFLPWDSIQAIQCVSGEASNETFKSREVIPVLPEPFDANPSGRNKFQMSCFLHKNPSLLRLFSVFLCPCRPPKIVRMPLEVCLNILSIPNWSNPWASWTGIYLRFIFMNKIRYLL